MKRKIIKYLSIVMFAVTLLMTSSSVLAAEISAEIELETDVTTETDITVETEPVMETEPETESIKVSELDLGDYLTEMTVGEKQLLNVTILPMEAGETTITYSSSDTNVATVNGMGRITALKLGSTSITAFAGGVSQSFVLNVIEEENTTIAVTDIEIGEYESELEVDKTLTLSGTIVPSDATDSVITYTSSNPSIATVSSSGEVKGISPGNVTITLSAGGVSKSVPLTVKVATTGITLNKDYLVLKSGTTYQLSAKVMPAEANQTITYHSADTSVADVSTEGLVTAKAKGTTTIIVSNGDTSVAASVIVNEAVGYQEEADVSVQDSVEEQVYEDCVLVSEHSVVDSEMLYSLYKNKQVLKIVGEGYVIEIDGSKIVNYNNEFHTDISLVKEYGKIRFNVNEGNELCGAITLYLDEPYGKYLYLYNTSKEKYQQIEMSDINKLELTTAGEYQLSMKKQQIDMRITMYIVIGGIVLLIVGVVVYIIIKRRYWFW